MASSVLDGLSLRNGPFILLDDSRPDHEAGSSLLFQQPSEIIVATHPEEVMPALARIDTLVSEGKHMAGYIAYEAAVAFENRLQAAIKTMPSEPLVWMMACDQPKRLNTRAVDRLLALSASGTDRKASLLDPKISTPKSAYIANIEQILDYIQAGDVYQVNYTFPKKLSVSGDPLALYQALRRSQPVPFGALINTGHEQFLSFSPELFLERRGDSLKARPMKGTMPRGIDHTEDMQHAQFLKQDDKSKAENLMIVDLIRNDLSRIAKPGSVKVDKLFSVEKYRTVIQMTSHIQATAQDGLHPSAALQAIFPCGSITGAPKIRAMEIISELEPLPRGIYCGAVGHFSPQNQWTLNVPIRTVKLTPTERRQQFDACLHIGSGIVADSNPVAEFEECHLKAGFIHRRAPQFAVLESMLYCGKAKAVINLESHLARMAASCTYFDYPFYKDKITSTLKAHLDCLLAQDGSRKVRLLVDENGGHALSSSALPAVADDGEPLYIAVAEDSVRSDDMFLQHKTTYRPLYDRYFKAAQANGLADIIFLNEKGVVTEGCISNILVHTEEGRWVTPPVSAGLLAGIGRQSHLKAAGGDTEIGEFNEDFLRAAKEIFIINSVRGLRKARLLPQKIRA